jgi:hypothetical protein
MAKRLALLLQRRPFDPDDRTTWDLGERLYAATSFCLRAMVAAYQVSAWEGAVSQFRLRFPTNDTLLARFGEFGGATYDGADQQEFDLDLAHAPDTWRLFSNAIALPVRSRSDTVIHVEDRRSPILTPADSDELRRRIPLVSDLPSRPPPVPWDARAVQVTFNRGEPLPLSRFVFLERRPMTPKRHGPNWLFSTRTPVRLVSVGDLFTLQIQERVVFRFPVLANGGRGEVPTHVHADGRITILHVDVPAVIEYADRVLLGALYPGLFTIFFHRLLEANREKFRPQTTLPASREGSEEVEFLRSQFTMPFDIYYASPLNRPSVRPRLPPTKPPFVADLFLRLLHLLSEEPDKITDEHRDTFLDELVSDLGRTQLDAVARFYGPRDEEPMTVRPRLVVLKQQEAGHV